MFCQNSRFLARFPFEYQAWLGEGHTLSNGNPPGPYVDGSQLTTILLMYPVFEAPGFRDGLWLDGEPVNLLWVQPITDRECELKLARGAGALYDLMENHQLPKVLDVGRKSVV